VSFNVGKLFLILQTTAHDKYFQFFLFLCMSSKFEIQDVQKCEKCSRKRKNYNMLSAVNIVCYQLITFVLSAADTTMISADNTI
jgi:hypothetical protein